MPREPLYMRLNALWVFQDSELCHQAVEVSTKVNSNDLIYGGEAVDHKPWNQEQCIFKIVHCRPPCNIFEVAGFIRPRIQIEYVRRSMCILSVKCIGGIIKTQQTSFLCQ